MAVWTELEDIPLGATVSTALWNTIFGPNGNQVYLKKYANNITYEFEKTYTMASSVVWSGWPQGLTTTPQGYEAYYDMGDVVFPQWYLIGVPDAKYITLSGPGKYLAILTVQYNPNAGDSSVTDPFFRVFILDTIGNLNIQKTIVPRGTTSSLMTGYEQYQFSFIVDAPFDTDVLIGFAAQSQYSSSLSIRFKFNFDIYAGSTIVFHKLPMLMDEITVTSSFQLGSSQLGGLSAF